MMGEVDVWILVEGRSQDRPFYERLFEQLPSLRGKRIAVILAEDVTRDGVSAGGKNHIIQLHNEYLESGDLVQRNSRGNRAVAFVIDRDLDHYLGEVIDSDFLMYTNHADVEAEILAHGDRKRYISTSFGLANEQYVRIEGSMDDPMRELAGLWESWLFLGLVALLAGTPRSRRFRNFSEINGDRFESVNEKEFREAAAALESSMDPESWTKYCERARAFLAEANESNRLSRLLKGKWIAPYIIYRIRQILSDEAIVASVSPNTVVTVALETLDFASAWVDHYESQASRLAERLTA